MNAKNDASPDLQVRVATPPTYVFYVAGVCLLAGIVRLLSRWTVVHHTIVMFLLGALFGHLSQHHEVFHTYVNVDFLTAAPCLQVHTLLLPIVILETVFSMDPRVFLSCKPIAVVTVVVDYLLTLLLQGVFVFFFLDFYDLPRDPVKTALIYLLVGSLTSVTDTSYVVNTLYKMGSYWVLIKMLEIKRVISLVGACCVYIFVVYVNELHYQFDWYNVVVFLALQLFASPLAGWVTAQIMIFWIGRLYNDIGVEITVSIAVAYLLYYLGTVNITAKPTVSAIAVVVYALLLNNSRKCFSLGLDTFLYKLVRILAYVVKTVIFTISGFLITNDDIVELGRDGMSFLPHLLVSFTLYSWCMLARGVICALLAPILRRSGFRLSWQELSTMVFCNVTGTVCLITAVATCNRSLVKLFYNNRQIQYMVMFHLGMLAIVRSLVAGTFFSRVLMVLGMRHVSLGRYLAMNNALQKIQEQITTSARTYKFDRFLADADWETVQMFTNFDDPYKDISRYSVIERCMDLDSEQLGDLRLNMLHAKRVSFWRQYEQGLLSLRALRILLEECYLAEWKVTTTGYDLKEQIRKHYEVARTNKGMFNVLRLLRQWFENQVEVRRQVIEEVRHATKGKFKKLVTKIALHMSLEIILLIAVLFSSAVSIVILVYELTCTGHWDRLLIHIFFHEVNIGFMVLLTVYLILKLYILGWRYFLLFGSLFNISVVIIGWIDFGLHQFVLMLPDKICAELIRTQWAITFHLVMHKIFLVYRCLRLLILLQDKTYFIVHMMKKGKLRHLQLGYDVGKAYVYCKEEVSQNASEFIANSATLGEIQRELQTGRVQLMRELATVQKKHPGIVVSVKSQEACRRLLHVAQETVNQLQINGRVDAYEADMLNEMIKLRLKRLNKIPAQIEMPSVDVLISKLSWVNGDENIMKFLQFNANLFNMAEGESADFDFDPTAGLYILVSGLIRVNWKIGEPYGPLIQSSHTDSEDTIHPHSTLQLHDYMTTGSTFGELALLTETPVVIDAVCETTVLMYHIQYESIRSALDWVKDPPLEWRLWLISAVRLSLPLLKALPAYYNTSLEDLKVLADTGSLILQRLESQFQDGRTEERFSLARYAGSHVILVHGTADKSGETFIGPKIIPPDNDDLVFSSIYCDMFVLYIIPHKAPAASVGFVTVTSTQSDISTAMDQSKDMVVQLAVPRPVMPTQKKRGRRMSVAASAAAAFRHLDHSMASMSPLRVLTEDTINELETESSAAESDKKGLEETKRTPEDMAITSRALFSPQPVKPDLTATIPASYSAQTVKSAETVEPTKEEVPEEPVMPSKRVSLIEAATHETAITMIPASYSPQTVKPAESVEPTKEEVPEKPQRVSVREETRQETPKETEVEKVTVSPDTFTRVDEKPRKSTGRPTADTIGSKPWREAWKRVSPQINVTFGSESETTTPGERDVARRRVSVAADKESARTSPTSTQRQVTDISATRQSTDVEGENENTNNSTNNSNILRLYFRERQFHSSDQIRRKTAATDSVSSDAVATQSSEWSGRAYGPHDKTSSHTTSVGVGATTPELNQSVVGAFNVPTAGARDDKLKTDRRLPPREVYVSSENTDNQTSAPIQRERRT